MALQMRTLLSSTAAPGGSTRGLEFKDATGHFPDMTLQIRAIFLRNSAGAGWLCGRRRQTVGFSTFSRKISIQEADNSCKGYQIPVYLKMSDFWRGRRPGYCVQAGAFPEPDSTGFRQTNVTQRSEEWFALRRDRLTTSSFGTVLGFWNDRRVQLWEEKVFVKEECVCNAAMSWGVLNEAKAIETYREITGNAVEQLGFKIYHENDELLRWLGASPDGLIEGCCRVSGISSGILEVKCPYNKGRPELGLPWASVPYYYMPQVQGLMEILDRDWVHFYVWTINASSVFRIHRDHEYWRLIYEILREFWWENIVPARQALLVPGGCNVYQYKPFPQHKHTGHVIAQSKAIAANSQLICREISGHVEFFQ